MNRLYWRLARQVRRARPVMVAAIAITVTALLSLPVMVSVIVQPPHQFYAQHYGVEIGEEPAFGFTAEHAYYADAHTQLMMPMGDLPEWALEERNFEEIFDNLALYNGYFYRFLLPALGMRLAIVPGMLLVYYIGIGYVIGLTRLEAHRLPFKRRVKCLIVSSYPPAALCLPIGLLMPVMHLFLFQLLGMLLGYMVLKEL